MDEFDSKINYFDKDLILKSIEINETVNRIPNNILIEYETEICNEGIKYLNLEQKINKI